MYASVEAVDGDIVIKFKKFLVEEGENEISFSGPQNFIYTFSDNFGEGHGSNRVKAGIDLRSEKVLVLPETSNDILIYIYGKIRMQYVVSDPDPDVGNGKQVTIAVTLTVSDTSGVVALGFPDESGGMVGAQATIGISQYNMIVKYGLKGYD